MLLLPVAAGTSGSCSQPNALQAVRIRAVTGYVTEWRLRGARFRQGRDLRAMGLATSPAEAASGHLQAVV
jgi:hypothetical protein